MSKSYMVRSTISVTDGNGTVFAQIERDEVNFYQVVLTGNARPMPASEVLHLLELIARTLREDDEKSRILLR